MRRYVWLAVVVASVGLVVAKGMVAAIPTNQSPVPVAEALQIGRVATMPMHDVDRPGIYGLATPPVGSRYAIVGNNLVRVDMTSNAVQAVIRSGVRPVNEAMLP